MPLNGSSPLRPDATIPASRPERDPDPPLRTPVEAISRFGWADELRASQERAARRRERLRERQATEAWLRHLTTGRSPGR